MNDNKKQIHVMLDGRVQGVGYRFYAQKIAASIGLVGEIKNLPDGRVEVIAEGDESMLKSFITKLRQGPVSADVRSVDVDWHEATNSYKEFFVTG